MQEHPTIPSTSAFSQMIEQTVHDSNGQCSYMEAVVDYCERNDLDIEAISKLISPSLKDKIKEEATQKNYFPKSAKLPI